MKVAVLFSGGKDSCFAAYLASQSEDVACLITLVSKNPESYMFHTPNIRLAGLQAESMGIPLIEQETRGVKEKELRDLEKAIKKAVEHHAIEGVVTGAVQSVYQSSRVQKICNKLDLWCFNPLWQADQREYMKSFLSSGFKAIISGVYAYPFDSSWLGREIDNTTLADLLSLSEKHKISITGEGGEFETFVFDSPLFRKKIKILKARKSYDNYSGVYKIEKAILVKK